MSSFGALYGRKCKTPVSLYNPTDISCWAIFSKENGTTYGKDKDEFKVHPR
jgi:hypothetical protein